MISNRKCENLIVYLGVNGVQLGIVSNICYHVFYYFKDQFKLKDQVLKT